MSKYLCTFPGKYGDILWALPTAKYIAEKVVSQPVDFAVMPYYESLLPLLQEQSYIDNAIILPDWLRTHSNYGDQPWQAPEASLERDFPGKVFNPPLRGEHLFKLSSIDFTSYEKVWHLGYRCHPGAPFGNPDMALMDFIAYQQGITFNDWPTIPFLTAPKGKWKEDFGLGLALAFNEQYAKQKQVFKEALVEALNGVANVYWLQSLSWLDAATFMDDKDTVAFIGDRSANWVIANGLGKMCITFEPHPSRHRSGQLGRVFGCPGGKEFALPFGMPAKIAGQTAATMVKKLVEERTMTAHG